MHTDQPSNAAGVDAPDLAKMTLDEERYIFDVRRKMRAERLMTLQRRYAHHPPRGTQLRRYEQIRAECLTLAVTLVNLVPASPELERALDALDDVMMRANAGIARTERWHLKEQDLQWVSDEAPGRHGGPESDGAEDRQQAVASVRDERGKDVYRVTGEGRRIPIREG